MSGKFEFPEDNYEYLKAKGIIKKMPSKCPYAYSDCLYIWGDRNIDYCSGCPKFRQAGDIAEYDNINDKSNLEMVGDAYLGSPDIELSVLDWLIEQFKNDHGIDLKQEKMAIQRLTDATKKAMKELSIIGQTEINLPFIAADASGPQHLNIILTRAKLEQLTGDGLCKRGLFDKALLAYSSSALLNPMDIQTWNKKGQCLDQLGIYYEALYAYYEALKINADNYLTWFNVATCLSLQGKYDEALQAIDNSLGLNQDFIQGWQFKGYCLNALERYSVSLPVLKKALSLNPDASETHRLLGFCFLGLGSLKKALKVFNTALSLDSHDPSSWFGKARCCELLLDENEAKHCYEALNNLGF